MGEDGDSDGPRKKRRISPPETGPYILRSLLDNVPVASDAAEQQDAYISCVEYWNGNLYIGTSIGEILHFVSLPADPSDETTEPTFMLASRLPINPSRSSLPPDTAPGVHQILVLPTANKACILCNGVLTFYSLPELSPMYGNPKVANCRWIGGLDLNKPIEEEGSGEVIFMVGLQTRIMLVKVSEEVRKIRSIEFPGCVAGSRRGTIACVADSRSYSLLEVEHRQKIPLFPIYPTEEEFDSGKVEDIPGRVGTPQGDLQTAGNGHGRSASLNSLGAGSIGRSRSPQPGTRGRSISGTPEPYRSSSRQPGTQEGDGLKPTAEAIGQVASLASANQKPLPEPPKSPTNRLKPLIASPSPSEFLFVTGTDPAEPGVGMFVNMDGEGVRGTVEFHRHPESIVIDNNTDNTRTGQSDADQEGYILAIIGPAPDEDGQKYIEAQRWNTNPGDTERKRTSLEIPSSDITSAAVGIWHTVSSNNTVFPDVAEIMRMVRLRTSSVPSPLYPSTPTTETPDPRTKASIEQLQKEKELFDGQETDSDGSRQPSGRLRRNWEVERNREESKFAKGLGKVNSSIIVWSGDQIWQVLRNPLALQLDTVLSIAGPSKETNDHTLVDRDAIISLLGELQSIEPKTETEFLGLSYIRQKASLLLFMALLSAGTTAERSVLLDTTENTLVVGGLDPRIVLLLIPLVRNEVLQGPQGIWVYNGLAKMAEPLITPPDGQKEEEVEDKTVDDSVLQMLKRYLLSWQQKRGYGSIADETYVFNSIDAALLHLLLEMDPKGRRGASGATTPPLRSELNKLVDNWKGDFSRAVELLESYHRLFVLSRLYQSRKMAKQVLGTWRRIIEGEDDLGGELSVSDAEMQVRKYLVRIRDARLVEEYGSWLAARNPSLGVQIFSDDNRRAQLSPSHVIALLKERAPNAVQEYLEHLVFTRNETQYADDLIAYYLDSVLSVLESSPEARQSLAESYSTYRALQPPKPSYLSFITHNAPLEPWWKSRLRLLQLLGGGGTSQYTSTPAPTDISYSIPSVLARIEPFQNELVSESIILDGRQGRHREALHLLTHGLGDYDTAIRYCVFGGPTSSTSTPPPLLTSSPDQSALFTHLLHEFMQIIDPSVRIERVSDLLARFAPLYDISTVLSLVPEDWSVDILSDYLVRVLRGLVSDSREVRVQRALSAGLYLQVDAQFVDGMEKVGGWVEEREGVVRGLKTGEGGGDGGDEGDGEDG
ncbi:hypothetical protein AJ80_06889 [Polytolypa hystricis UAMH7299]|uniref:CNH domain-containing protein n=1 Tax=Polytolypa hystricis (strain UAMH7299) TaxID=1447883 RepID=A0A2B7XSV2_POLH7|nr:hypothetical protein AJ80_06889 [Polytolypa hystricis UAMH7299]